MLMIREICESDGDESARLKKAKNKPEKTPSRARKAVYTVGMMVVSLSVCVLLVEVPVRVFFPQPGGWTLLVADDRYHHAMQPNYRETHALPAAGHFMEVETNSLGFRDEEFDPSRTDTVNLLILGDSIAFGMSADIEQRFDTKLRSALAGLEDEYQSLNAGVPGWGTIQETQYAKDHWEVLKPDIILLIFSQTDFRNDAMFLADPQFPTQNCLRSPVLRFLRVHSHTARFLQNKLFTQWELRQVRRRLEAEGVPPKVWGTESDWQSTKECIRSFHQEFVGHNPNGVLIVIAGVPGDKGMHDNLRPLSNGANLIYLDLYEEVHTIGQEALKHPFDENWHWSAAMHSLVAERLFERIESAALAAGS